MLNKDTAVMRGVRTALQAVIGLVTGLILAIWAVPGVPETVTNYLQDNLVQMALLVGVPSGVAGFIWNYFRPSVKNF